MKGFVAAMYLMVAFGMASQLWVEIPEPKRDGAAFAVCLAFGMFWPMFAGANLVPETDTAPPVKIG